MLLEKILHHTLFSVSKQNRSVQLERIGGCNHPVRGLNPPKLKTLPLKLRLIQVLKQSNPQWLAFFILKITVFSSMLWGNHSSHVPQGAWQTCWWYHRRDESAEASVQWRPHGSRPCECPSWTSSGDVRNGKLEGFRKKNSNLNLFGMMFDNDISFCVGKKYHLCMLYSVVGTQRWVWRQGPSLTKDG